jgi:hypothetical protein
MAATLKNCPLRRDKRHPAASLHRKPLGRPDQGLAVPDREQLTEAAHGLQAVLCRPTIAEVGKAIIDTPDLPLWSVIRRFAFLGALVGIAIAARRIFAKAS